MASQVIILTGAPGTGKTTIARHWATRRAGAAIEADQIRGWITDKQIVRGHAYQEAALAEIATAAAIQFLHQNMDVAIENVWTPRGIEVLMENFSTKAPARCVWLHCDLKENHRRDGLRAAQDQMGRRVDEVANELASYHWPVGMVRMDTTLDSVEQTFERLEALF